MGWHVAGATRRRARHTTQGCVYMSLYTAMSCRQCCRLLLSSGRPRAAGAASCASVMCDPRTTARRGNRADAPPPPATPGRGAKSAVAGRAVRGRGGAVAGGRAACGSPLCTRYR